MIVLNPNTTNTISLSLRELCVDIGSSGEYYGLLLINKMSGGETWYSTLTDISQFKDFYQTFNISVGDLMEGEYTYNVYQLVNQGDNYSGEPIETGLCIVKQTSVISVFDLEDTKNQGVFDED